MGIITHYRHLERRTVLRSIYSQFPPNVLEKVDIRFVVGQPRADDTIFDSWLQWEQDKEGDLIILDCEENMNDGKTWFYYKTVYEKCQLNNDTKYSHVMKVDDDSFINFPSLLKFIEEKVTQRFEFFGRKVCLLDQEKDQNAVCDKELKTFMHGGAYGITAELLDVLVTSEIPIKVGVHGAEDIRTAAWLNELDTPVTWTDFGHLFHTPPDAPGNWKFKSEWDKNAVVVHRIKSTELWIQLGNFFLQGIHPGTHLPLFL